MDYSFNAFESVITYAIDNIEGSDDVRIILNEIELNEETFYKEIYVNRQSEESIFKHLDSSFTPLLVYGFPGTGKTSIISKAINDLKKSRKCELFKFDFKGEDNIVNYNRNIKEFHNTKLRTKIEKYLTKANIDDMQIVKYFFEERNTNYEMSIEFEDYRRKLFNEYRSTKSTLTFYEWFSHLCENKIIDKEEFNKLRKYLRNRDYLNFISKNDISNPIKCIIFYDNLDNIISNKIRSDFHEYIREYSGIIGRFANIIITSRVKSIANTNLTDYGALYWHKEQIDYQEFIDKKLFSERENQLFEKKGYCDLHDQRLIRMDLESSAKEIFTKKIIEKRTNFLEKVIKEKELSYKIDNEKINSIKEIYNIILHNDHIHVALLELANHDRHWMFRFLFVFVMYLFNDLKLKLEEIGDNFEERSYIIESYFYQWALYNDQINCSVYNIVKDTENWYKHRTGFGCSLTYLLFAVIYNLTNQARSQFTYTSKTTLNEVIEKLLELGFSENHILSRIFDLYKKEDRYIGHIEISLDVSIEQYSDLKKEYQIWLTPKAVYLCEYLSLKFFFMTTLYKNMRIKDFSDKTFDYNDKTPVTLGTIGTNLFYLCKIANMHLEALQFIKRRLKNKKNWFTYYRCWFCIRSESDYSDYLSDLHLTNILRSHILFLRHQSSINTHDFITDSIIQQYKLLENEYLKAVKSFVDEKDCIKYKNYDFQSLIDYNLFKFKK